MMNTIKQFENKKNMTTIFRTAKKVFEKQKDKQLEIVINDFIAPELRLALQTVDGEIIAYEYKIPNNQTFIPFVTDKGYHVDNISIVDIVEEKYAEELIIVQIHINYDVSY